MIVMQDMDNDAPFFLRLYYGNRYFLGFVSFRLFNAIAYIGVVGIVCGSCIPLSVV